MRVLLGELPALDAGEAAVDGVGRVPPYRQHPSVFDVNLQRTARVAGAAERPLCLNGHGDPLPA